jgi:Zn-dependent M32 family carboxypeptidase
MTDLEKQYYEKWKEQVLENRKLKQELEKHQKIDERLKDLKWQTVKYKKYFEPLAAEYKEVYDFSQLLVSYMEKLVSLYNNYVLLNPNFNVRLSEGDKNKIIKELQLILLEFLKLKIPKEYEIIRDLQINPKIPKTTRKEFERKNFIIKKNK